MSGTLSVCSTGESIARQVILFVPRSPGKPLWNGSFRTFRAPPEIEVAAASVSDRFWYGEAAKPIERLSELVTRSRLLLKKTIDFAGKVEVKGIGATGEWLFVPGHGWAAELGRELLGRMREGERKRTLEVVVSKPGGKRGTLVSPVTL